MSVLLLQCPFCGAEAKRIDLEEGDDAGASCIACTKCSVSTALHFDRKENLIDSWNRRVTNAPKVVAAFISPDTPSWQGRLVNVTEDGAWWTLGMDNKWSADLPPLPKEQTP